MKKHFIIFFVIMIGGIMFYSYLNQSNLKEGFDTKKTYKANDNTTAVISQNRNGSYTITVTNLDNTTTTYITSVGDTSRQFFNPDTSYAFVSQDEKIITVTSANNSKKIFYNISTSSEEETETETEDKDKDDYDNYNHFDGTSNASVYYSSNGSGYTARILDTGTNKMIIVTKADGTTLIYYYSGYPNLYNGQNGSFIKLITAKDGKKTIELTTSSGKKMYYVNRNLYSPKKSDIDNFETTDHYNSSLPNGIKGSQIPIGYEDMYILKSQIVPPVYPACPSYSLSCPSTTESKGSKGSDDSSTSSSSNTGSKGSNDSSSSSSSSSNTGSKGSNDSSSSSASSTSSSNNPAANVSNKDYSSRMYNPNDLNEINKNGNGNKAGTNYKKPSMTIPIPVLSDFSMFGM